MDFVDSIVNAAKPTVCKLYHDYKDWYHQNINLASPTGHLLENFWNNLCPSEPPYQPPQALPGSDFQGGQCECVLYKVSGTIYATKYNNLSGLNTTNWWGPIGGVRSYYTVNDGRRVDLYCRGHESSPCGELGWYYWYGSGFDTEDYPMPATITGVSRVDGLADNCGNPPNNPPPPVAPPPTINTDITVSNTTNNTTNNTTFNLPIIVAPKLELHPELGLSIRIVAPVISISPSLNPQFNFNPELNINPAININIGAGGNSYSFDGGGGGVGGSPDIEPDCDVCTITQHTLNNTDAILKILTDVPTYKSGTIVVGESGKKDGELGLSYLEVEVLKPPASSKTYFGGQADNVSLCGWITFRKNGYNYSRVQIQNDRTIYSAPFLCDGFSFCFTYGANGKVTSYLKNEVE